VTAMPRPAWWPFGRRDAAAVARTDSAPLPEAPTLLDRPPTPLQLAVQQRRADNWTNAHTGVGIAGVDPALQTTFLAQVGISDEEAVALDRADPIAAKVINKPVDEAFRPGFEPEIVEDDAARDTKGKRTGTDERPAEKLKRDVKARWKALGAMKAVRKAWKWSRREGGSAILLGCADIAAAGGMHVPLSPKGKVDLRWLRVLRAADLYPATYYTDPAAEKFDEPETWMVTMGRNGRGSTTIRVHESRLIIFEGVRVVDEAYQGQLHPGFGDSILLRFYRALRRYGTTMSGIEKLLGRFGQPWMKIARLSELFAADRHGELQAALDAYEYAASVFNVRVVDGGDEYGTSAPAVGGLHELVTQVRGELQAAADMPLSILFGDIVGGLGDNATGVKRDWLDTVGSLREEHAIPPLTRITELVIRGIGSGVLPGDWSVVGNPLWHPTTKERAEVEKIDAEIDAMYLTGSVVLPEMVMRRPEVAKRYAIDLAALEELEDARAKVTEEARQVGGEDPEDEDEEDRP
jgi:phage-related protein (TIGR01555 family)